MVGYFCNLCQLIYADEDEAKLQHCSTLTHYRKYQVIYYILKMLITLIFMVLISPHICFNAADCDRNLFFVSGKDRERSVGELNV